MCLELAPFTMYEGSADSEANNLIQNGIGMGG